MNGDSTRSEMSIEEYHRLARETQEEPQDFGVPWVICAICHMQILRPSDARLMSRQICHTSCEQNIRVRIARRERTHHRWLRGLTLAAFFAAFALGTWSRAEDSLWMLILGGLCLPAGFILDRLERRQAKLRERAFLALHEPWAIESVLGKRP